MAAMAPENPYASAGVDEEREQDVFAQAMRPWLARTAVRSSLVTSITGLASGYFATLMHIPPGPPCPPNEPAMTRSSAPPSAEDSSATWPALMSW